MSNNQDFILKNAIEVGKDTKVTLGTITSGTVDLSTGNYFAETLATDTTYTFSNPGDVQSFQLEVTGGAAGYSLATASYDSKSFSTATQTTSPISFVFKPDGSKLYVLGNVEDTVFQYSLSTAWDVGTASYDSKIFSVASQETTPIGICLTPDGSTMYVIGVGNNTIYQYTLSTAWDISTASYASKSFSVASQDTSPLSVTLNNDGTKIYVAGNTNDTIYQYALSTAYDISTASYGSVSLNVSAQGTNPRTVTFNADGTKMVIPDGVGNTVYEYSLSTGFDLSTAVYSGVSFSVTSQTTSLWSSFYSSDGEKLYVSASTEDTIFQYSTTTDATLTWPASVQWPSGATPFAPAVGETDVYTFVTDDSGTTYIGLQTADNLS